ncbi:YPP1 [Candida pseudojiufengensis]|uniref:YPP1 n=1 Tax=Candida pseudojiufengensis TaxID=497109 RepID=UPI002223F26D|nr:YPP1 [Candida pseudojiufengensis]KAI5965563.1 YPP1 [Candida pseudojiufengensis]
MYIESSINDKYIGTLNFGCFPKNVLQFQESQDLFQQLIFIDYQLQLLINNEFNGQELTTLSNFQGINNPKEKLIQLINYTNSININYNKENRSYEENLYYIVLISHLLYLDGNLIEMNKILNSINVSYQVNKNLNVSINTLDFISYLTVRYYTLYGLSTIHPQLEIWFQYLDNFKHPFSKSQVIANHWLDLLFKKLTIELSKNGTIQFSFVNNISNLPFYKNKLSIISYSNFLLRPEQYQIINKSFKTDYSSYLNIEINECIHSKIQFPDANEPNNQVNDFINNLYESLSYVPFNLAIFKPSLSKKFLIDATTKTYQSRIVLSNFIYTLIDLNEYDEALAGFNTYIAYIEKDQELKEGYIEDILSIIDTYSTCIIHFNPLKSFAKNPKFKYTDEPIVLDNLKKFVKELQSYLEKLNKLVDLAYDDENYAGDKNPLSFLYRKYNLNVLQSDQSQFIELISKAWHSIGYYYSYLSNFESPNQKILDFNISQILKNYKNSLIINSTGNVLYLFTYALALANTSQLKPSLKLCKFILKKYPESFKTWNLLVLLITSFNNDNDEIEKPAGFNDNILPDNFTNSNGGGQIDSKINGYIPPKLKIREPEKFINKALNISGLYILKHQQRDIKLSFESKYEILQLKLTQLAVLESIHGSQYMIDYISEVFVLYHELFDINLNSSSSLSSRQFAANEKWSHRPSFIDPNELNNVRMNSPEPLNKANALPSNPPLQQQQIPPQSSHSTNHQNGGEKILTSSNSTKKHSHNPVDRLKRFSKIPNLPTRDSILGRRDSIMSTKSNTSATSSGIASVNSAPHHIKKPEFKNGNIFESSTSNQQQQINEKQALIQPQRQPPTQPQKHTDNLVERKLLQDIWLWTSNIFLKNGLYEESEQCINEAELIYENNFKILIARGFLNSKTKKFLSLQNFEKSLEILTTTNNKFNKFELGLTIIGLSKLFLIDDDPKNSIFISTKDYDAGIIRIKNLLEQFSLSFPHGFNNIEIWYFLSKIYEIIDDKILLTKSLWKCIELEDLRPVRNFEVCNLSL